MILTIDENTEDIRLDLYLSELYDGISRSKIQSSIKSGKVLVNGVLMILAFNGNIPLVIPVVIITRDTVVDSIKMVAGIVL